MRPAELAREGRIVTVLGIAALGIARSAPYGVMYGEIPRDGFIQYAFMAFHDRVDIFCICFVSDGRQGDINSTIYLPTNRCAAHSPIRSACRKAQGPSVLYKVN